jgi:integrase
MLKIRLQWTIYEFRHTFATRFGEKVGDPIALARILGHSDLRSVMKYCHPQESHTAGAMRRYHSGPKADRGHKGKGPVGNSEHQKGS